MIFDELFEIMDREEEEDFTDWELIEDYTCFDDRSSNSELTEPKYLEKGERNESIIEHKIRYGGPFNLSQESDCGTTWYDDANIPGHSEYISRFAYNAVSVHRRFVELI